MSKSAKCKTTTITKKYNLSRKKNKNLKQKMKNEIRKPKNEKLNTKKRIKK